MNEIRKRTHSQMKRTDLSSESSDCLSPCLKKLKILSSSNIHEPTTQNLENSQNSEQTMIKENNEDYDKNNIKGLRRCEIDEFYLDRIKENAFLKIVEFFLVLWITFFNRNIFSKI